MITIIINITWWEVECWGHYSCFHNFLLNSLLQREREQGREREEGKREGEKKEGGQGEEERDEGRELKKERREGEGEREQHSTKKKKKSLLGSKLSTQFHFIALSI